MSHYYCFDCHGADEAEFDAIARAIVPPYRTCDLCCKEAPRLARSSLPSWRVDALLSAGVIDRAMADRLKGTK